MRLVNRRFLLFVIIGAVVIVVLAVLIAGYRQSTQPDVPVQEAEVISDTEKRYVIVETDDPEVFEERKQELEQNGIEAIPSGRSLRIWRAQITEVPDTHGDFGDPIETVP